MHRAETQASGTYSSNTFETCPIAELCFSATVAKGRRSG